MKLILEALMHYKFKDAIELTNDENLKKVFKLCSENILSDNKMSEAISFLVNIGSPIIPFLIELRNHGKSQIQFITDEALFKLGWEPYNIEEKIWFFSRRKAWQELANLGEAAIPELIRNNRYDELVQFGQLAVPALIEDKNQKGGSWLYKIDEERIFKTLIKIGQPAIPALVKTWQKYQNIFYSELLNKLGWEPIEDNEKVIFYNHSKQWHKLVKIGEPAIKILIENCRWDELLSIGHTTIPKLVDKWQKSYKHEDKHNIARTLYELKWVPPTLDLQLEFYYDATLYNELVKIGDPAIDFLYKHSLHQELAEIGESALPALLLMYKNPENYYLKYYLNDDILKIKTAPETDDDKVLYYFIHKNWDELVKLENISLPYLINILNTGFSGQQENAAKALEQFGNKATKSLTNLLLKVNEEGIITHSDAVRIETLQYIITSILLNIKSEDAIFSILNSFHRLTINRNTEEIAIKLNEILPLFQHRQVIEAKEKMIKILIEKFKAGYKYTKILNAFSVNDEIIINTYINLLKELERPSDYNEILEYFIKNKCSRAVDVLFDIITVPKSGKERFYKDIITTIGKIGDKSTIPRLKSLLYSNWAIINHTGKIEKYIDSKWIEPLILSAINELEGKTDVSKKRKNNIEKEKSNWWRFWK